MKQNALNVSFLVYLDRGRLVTCYTKNIMLT